MVIERGEAMVTITVTVGPDELKALVTNDLVNEFRVECRKQFGPDARIEVVYELES